MKNNTDFSDLVLNIYPDAKCFSWNGSYCIMDISEKAKTQLSNYNLISTKTICYSKWRDTPHLAWMDAWEEIQLRMLEKFKND
jgi:hypothetical protein